MELFLAHIPHIALILALVLLFVRMEVGERRMRAAVAGGGDLSAGEIRAMSVRGAIRTLLLMVLLAAVAVMIIQVLRGVDPSGFIVIDYLVAGGVLAVWFAWAAPNGLAPAFRDRLGRIGRGAVRIAVLVVTLGGVAIAGMVLAHGVALPAL